MDTWELLRRSLGILTSGNHNSLYTRATVSLRSSPSPAPSPLVHSLSQPRSSSPSSPSRLDTRPRALRLSSSSPPLVAPSPCRPLPPSPLMSRSFCRVGHGYSAIVFDLSCSCCGCRLPGDFTCLPLPRTLPGLSLLLPPPLSRSFYFSLSVPSAPSPSGTLVWYLFPDPSHLLPDFLPPSQPPPFILEMGGGIHETKLMITTSKQRTERPTATCRAIYIYRLLRPATPFLPSFLPTRLVRRFLRVSALRLSHFVSFLRCSFVALFFFF